MTVQLKSIPIELLKRGKYQPRKVFEEGALQELANSLQSQGLIEPLIVRKLDNTFYEIIAGERRWRAAQLAGLTELQCLVGNYTDEQAAAVTLIENIQRQDLNLLEEAMGFKRLTDEFQFLQEEVATLVGKSRSHIANSLRLLSLCSTVQEHIQNKNLSAGHARMLVGLTTQQQIKLAEQIIKQNWSVRRVEQAVRAIKENVASPTPTPTSQDVLGLQSQLSEHFGAPVEILSQQGQGGWLRIKFYDNDTLSGLLDRLGINFD